jgi:hypothetical protein
MSHVTGEWLEIGDDEVGLRFVDKIFQATETSCGLGDCGQIPGDGALVAHTIVKVGEAETINLGDVKFGLQILQAAIERCDMDDVTSRYEMREDFLRPGGMTRTVAVYAVQDVGLGVEGRVYRPEPPIAAR